MAFVEATVVLFKCDKTGKSYGVRLEKTSNDDWVRTWAFPVEDIQEKYENYEKQAVSGSFRCTDEFPGCPYCGTDGFIKCSCGKITCWRNDNEEENFAKCLWCGFSGKINVSNNNTFDISGSSF